MTLAFETSTRRPDLARRRRLSSPGAPRHLSRDRRDSLLPNTQSFSFLSDAPLRSALFCLTVVDAPRVYLDMQTRPSSRLVHQSRRPLNRRPAAAASASGANSVCYARVSNPPHASSLSAHLVSTSIRPSFGTLPLSIRISRASCVRRAYTLLNQ